MKSTHVSNCMSRNYTYRNFKRGFFFFFTLYKLIVFQSHNLVKRYRYIRMEKLILIYIDSYVQSKFALSVHISIKHRVSGGGDSMMVMHTIANSDRVCMYLCLRITCIPIPNVGRQIITG